MNPANGPFADTPRCHMTLGRYGEPAETASFIAYLASSPEAGYTTGTCLLADGGLST